MTINTSFDPSRKKGGERLAHCNTCTCTPQYTSTIPRAMREALTIPAEAPVKRERKSHCPSGENKLTCDVRKFRTRSALTITSCVPCNTKRIVGGGHTRTIVYKDLSKGVTPKVILREVPYKL